MLSPVQSRAIELVRRYNRAYGRAQVADTTPTGRARLCRLAVYAEGDAERLGVSAARVRNESKRSERAGIQEAREWIRAAVAERKAG